MSETAESILAAAMSLLRQLNCCLPAGPGVCYTHPMLGSWG